MKTTSIIILSFLSIFSAMAQPQKKMLRTPSQSVGNKTNTESALSQIVNIPDAKFKQSLIDLGVDENSDGQIQLSEAQIITSLKLSSKSISSLSGIEAFVNLTSLNCSDNQLTTLDVSKNTALTIFGCNKNQLTTIDVSKNTALTILNCRENKLSAIDIRMNTALTRLLCEMNQLTTIDVSKNTALTNLSCSGNQIKTIDVSKNSALTDLSCSFNQLVTIDVSKNIGLTKFNCRYNPNLLKICINTTQFGFTTSTPSNWLKDNTAVWNSDCIR